MITPRPYQLDAISAISAASGRGVRRQIVALPTGTGKTVVFALLAKRAVDHGHRVLVLAHRDELLEQAAHKLGQVDPDLTDRIGFVRAGDDATGAQVVIASVQTVSRPRRLARLADDFALVIVDEAHHSAADSYQRILAAIHGRLQLGMTATPQRADSKDLAKTWDEVVFARDLLWMIREQYLCDMRGIRVRLSGFDVSTLKVSHGDFTDESAARALDFADAPDHAAAAYLEHAAGRPCLVFTPTVDLSRKMAAAFVAKGVAAEHLDGETPHDDRKAILRRLRDGTTRVVSNVGVLTEGFDEPSVSCIIMARPTRSQPLYVQIVGRGSRTYPGKEDCIVLDLVGASDRNDLITLPLLFGLGTSKKATEALESSGVLAATAVMANARAMSREAVEVDLFHRGRKVAWIINDGAWSLSIGSDGVLVIERTPNGLYAVVLLRTGGGRSVVGPSTGTDFGYAVGIAEDYARKEAGSLVDMNAPWRRRPATERQIDLLVRRRLTSNLDITAGEASDLIGAYRARQLARHH